MTDRTRSSVDGNQAPLPPRNPSEPLARKENGGRPFTNGEADIIALVRSLQRTAGVADCFRKGRADCDDIRCNWRIYCLETQPGKGNSLKNPRE